MFEVLIQSLRKGFMWNILTAPHILWVVLFEQKIKNLFAGTFILSFYFFSLPIPQTSALLVGPLAPRVLLLPMHGVTLCHTVDFHKLTQLQFWCFHFHLPFICRRTVLQMTSGYLRGRSRFSCHIVPCWQRAARLQWS